MTIYWERCSTCSRHRPTRQCWLHPEKNVCPYCCISCHERNMCPKPAWFPSLKTAAKPVVKQARKRLEAKKALEDLLKKLEAG